MFVPVPSVDCLSLPGHLLSGAVHKANHRIIIIIIILIIIIIMMMMMMMMMTMMMMIIIITKSKESTEPREWQLLKNHRDWCTWNYLEERKGLVWEVESACHFWKHTVVSHPWYCSYHTKSVVSLSCRKLLKHGWEYPRKYQRKATIMISKHLIHKGFNEL